MPDNYITMGEVLKEYADMLRIRGWRGLVGGLVIGLIILYIIWKDDLWE
jgi:hypothetical protein